MQHCSLPPQQRQHHPGQQHAAVFVASPPSPSPQSSVAAGVPTEKLTAGPSASAPNLLPPSASSPRSVLTHAAAPTMTTLQQQQPPQKNPPTPVTPTPVTPTPPRPGEARNPFDEFADVAAAAAAATTTPPIAKSASFDPLPSTNVVGGGVERKNPFDELRGADLLGGAAPATQPPSLPPYRGRPQGHHKTQSLCLPSEFRPAVAPVSPVPASLTAPTTPTVVPEGAAVNPDASAALKDLAASLSRAKPRALTDQEKAEESRMVARISLGERPRESTGTKKSHERTSSSIKGSIKRHVKGAVKDSIAVVKDPRAIKEIAQRHAHHGKSSSLDRDAASGIVDGINDAGGGTKIKESKPGGGGSGFGGLTMTPKKAASMRKLVGGLADLSAPLTPKDEQDKAGRVATTPKKSSSVRMLVSGQKDKVSGIGMTHKSISMRKLMGGLADLSLTPGGTTTSNGKAKGSKKTASSVTSTPNRTPAVASAVVGSTATSGEANLGLGSAAATIALPDLATVAAPPTYASACSYAASSSVIPALRSSELDPAPHQVEIPPVDDLLFHARACRVLDGYHRIDQNFDFGALVGMSRMGLEAFVNPVSVDEDEDENEGDVANVMSDQAELADGRAARLETVHRPIVSSVLGCADDVVVDGFFHEVGGAGDVDAGKRKTEDDTGVGRDKAPDDRVECAVLHSRRRRQFVVVWRGTSADQLKPVRNRHVRAWKESARDRSKGKDGAGGENLTSLDGKESATVFPPYLDSYLSSDLESRVFRLLDALSDARPFCDVVMTGRSFGAALATLAAVRYASSRPMMRASCHVFGSPRVGDGSFRRWANSLPNLRVMRAELAGMDPWVNFPEGAEWTHAGHSLAVDPAAAAALAGEGGGGGGEAKSDNGDKAAPMRAYRFDKHRPGSSDGSGGGAAGWLDWAGGTLGVGPGTIVAGHHHHHGKELAGSGPHAYVGALEKISLLGLRWPREYVGEDVGRGVKGSGKEKRLVV